MPKAVAASGSEPMAYRSRPGRVPAMYMATAMTTRMASSVMMGNPRTVFTESAPKASGRSPAKYCFPPAQALFRPRNTYKVPRVMTRAGTLAAVTRRPLIAPSRAPKAMPITNTAAIGRSGIAAKMEPVPKATSPSIEPTDRSMFRVMISRVCPAARIITMVAFNRRSLTPCGVRNSGLIR
ncbi:hypothetical protein BJQ90_03464 [Arthrobacter sp. SO3]|nr:hypothetical protein [Arthrobacter sp. SO3]